MTHDTKAPPLVETLKYVVSICDIHKVDDSEQLRLSSRKFYIGLSVGDLRAVLAALRAHEAAEERQFEADLQEHRERATYQLPPLYHEAAEGAGEAEEKERAIARRVGFAIANAGPSLTVHAMLRSIGLTAGQVTEALTRPATPSRARQAEGREERGWLVEWPQSINNHPRWWHPERGWCIDAGFGMRFSRQEDAEAFIKSQRGLPHAVATEHVWLDGKAATPAPPPVTLEREEVERLLYAMDPIYEEGESVDGPPVSPGGYLSWERFSDRVAEFGDDRLFHAYADRMAMIKKTADAIIALARSARGEG